MNFNIKSYKLHRTIKSRNKVQPEIQENEQNINNKIPSDSIKFKSAPLF